MPLMTEPGMLGVLDDVWPTQPGCGIVDFCTVGFATDVVRRLAAAEDTCDHLPLQR
jgi:hypothetical protein